MRILGRIVVINVEEPYGSLIRLINGKIIKIVQSNNGNTLFVIKDRLRDINILVSPYFENTNLYDFINNKEIAVGLEIIKKDRGAIKELGVKDNTIPLGIGTLRMPLKKENYQI